MRKLSIIKPVVVEYGPANKTLGEITTPVAILIVRFKVNTLSHPTEFNKVCE